MIYYDVLIRYALYHYDQNMLRMYPWHAQMWTHPSVRPSAHPSMSNAFLLLFAPDRKSWRPLPECHCVQARGSGFLSCYSSWSFSMRFEFAREKKTCWNCSKNWHPGKREIGQRDVRPRSEQTLSDFKADELAMCPLPVVLACKAGKLTLMTSGRLWDVCMAMYGGVFVSLTGSYNNYSCNSLQLVFFLHASCMQNNVRNHIGKVYPYSGCNFPLRLKQGRKTGASNWRQS